MKKKGKKTNDKLMIFKAKLQEIELIIRIISLNIIHLGIKCFNFSSVEPRRHLEYGCQFVICLDTDFYGLMNQNIALSFLSTTKKFHLSSCRNKIL